MKTNRLIHPIRLLRFVRHLSLDDLRREVGISQAKLSRIERGAASPTQEEAQVLAAFFGCSLPDLFAPDDIVRESI